MSGDFIFKERCIAGYSVTVKMEMKKNKKRFYTFYIFLKTDIGNPHLRPGLRSKWGSIYG